MRKSFSIELAQLKKIHTVKINQYSQLFGIDRYKGGWSAEKKNINQWIQAEFPEEFKITGIKTQGKNVISQWVESYKIKYSNNGYEWNDFKNTDGVEQVFNIFLKECLCKY